MVRAVVQIPVTLPNHDVRNQQELRSSLLVRSIITIDDSDWPASPERHTEVLAIGKDLDQAALAAQPEACAAVA